MPVYVHLDDDYATLALGQRIRTQRKRRQWTLVDLASRLAVSIGTLSAIENDKSPVDTELLLSLCTVLQVPLTDLLPQSPTSHFHIARHGQIESEPALPMKVVNRATDRLERYHNRLWPLAKPFVGKHLEPFEIEVQPVVDQELRFISHNHEEFVFVIDGRIQCLIKTPQGRSEATLAAGDCIYFWSYLPHCIRSVHATPARTIHVEYSPFEFVDAEYSNAGSEPTIYLIDEGQENLGVQIAGKIVSLRRARGMTTAQLAAQIRISPRKLKQIEAANQPISLDLLLQVCRTFQKPKEYFLSHSLTEPPFSAVLRARDIRRDSNGSSRRRRAGGCLGGGAVTALAEGFPKRGMHPAIVRLRRNRGAPEMVRHVGQEFVYVLRGAVRFLAKEGMQSVDERLMPGDACFLDSSLPHAFTESAFNPYDSAGAELLIVRCSTANPHGLPDFDEGPRLARPSRPQSTSRRRNGPTVITS